MTRLQAAVAALALLLAGVPLCAQTDPAAPVAVDVPASTADAARAAGGVSLADLLDALPAVAESFLTVADVSRIADEARTFSERTGLPSLLEDQTVLDMLSLKVSARGGIAPGGAAGIAYLDAEEFKDRNVVYLLPVVGQSEFVEYNAAREIEKGLYQMTGAEQPRFFTFRGRHALFSDSIRTTRAVREGAFDRATSLTAEQRQAAAGADVYLHFETGNPTDADEEKTSVFRNTVAGRFLSDPTLQPYSDLLLAYVQAVNEVTSQLESVDVALAFEDDDVDATLQISFADGGSISDSLHGLGGGASTLTDRLPLDALPLVSVGSVKLDRQALSDAAGSMVEFLTLAVPSAQKHVQPETRDHLLGAVTDMMGQVSGEMAFIAALPHPESGSTEASLTVVGLRDPEKFADARGAFFQAMTKASDEIGSRVRLRFLHRQETYRDVPIDFVRPAITFATPRFERLFEERAQKIYGPDGFIYRMAIVNDRLLVTVGSDVTLLHRAIDLALDDERPAVPQAVADARRGLPADSNIELVLSLPALLSRQLILAGPAQGAARRPVEFDDEDRKAIESQGLVGVAISLEGGRVRLDTSVGYDELGGAVAFAQRYLPPMDPTQTEEPETGPTPEPEPATTPTPEPQVDTTESSDAE